MAYHHLEELAKAYFHPLRYTHPLYTHTSTYHYTHQFLFRAFLPFSTGFSVIFTGCDKMHLMFTKSRKS